MPDDAWVIDTLALIIEYSAAGQKLKIFSASAAENYKWFFIAGFATCFVAFLLKCTYHVLALSPSARVIFSMSVRWRYSVHVFPSNIHRFSNPTVARTTIRCRRYSFSFLISHCFVGVTALMLTTVDIIIAFIEVAAVFVGVLLYSNQTGAALPDVYPLSSDAWSI